MRVVPSDKLAVEPLRFALRPGEKPRASPVVRLQVSRGDRYVSGRDHTSLVLKDLDRVLVRLLDGTRDRTQLTDEVVAHVERGELPELSEGVDPGDHDSLVKRVGSAVGKRLDHLAACALLIS